MTRVDDDLLALHLEVALATASSALLERLADLDPRRRRDAIAEIVRQLVDRLRCFEIKGEATQSESASQPSLFPQGFGGVDLVPVDRTAAN